MALFIVHQQHDAEAVRRAETCIKIRCEPMVGGPRPTNMIVASHAEANVSDRIDP
jgi:hypothetical protein